MMPHDTQLWVMAGRRSARSGDMAAARGFFMRGCRFCTQDGTLWIEYARCEMEWLKKVDQRKSKPGADPLRPDRPEGDDEIRIHDSDEEEDGDEEGDTLLPEPSKDEAKVIDKKAANQLQNNPAMDGAIPMAIFDIARKQRFFNADSAEQFFVMFASFKDVSVQPKISRHVLDAMDQVYPNHPATCNVHIRQPILGVSPKTADFPRGLREVIPRLSKYLEITTDRAELERKTARWIDEYLTVEDLDEGIRRVLEHTKGKLASV